MTTADGSTSGGAAGRGSFGALYAEAAPTLVAWARLRTRGALRTWIDPEDLVQEVACRTFEKFEKFDPAKGVFRRWLFGVANNVLKEMLGAAAKPGAAPARLEVSSRDLLDQLPDDVTSVSRRLARDEALTSFIDRLDGLEDEDRKLLIYRGLEGLGHAEAADLLGITKDAAEKRWQRLVRRVEEFRPPRDLFAP